MTMNRYRRTTSSQYLVVILILAAMIGVGFLGFLIMNRFTFVDHFVLPWSAGRAWLLSGESPYSPNVTDIAANALEESSFQASLPETQVLAQPLLTLVFYLPFSLIPYTISRVIWTTVLSICVGLIAFFSIRLSGWKLSNLEQMGLILVMVIWPPSVNAIIGGHLAPIIIALLLAGIYLITDGQDTTAGFVLALTVSSFLTSGLILLLLLIWSISTKRWSILAGMFSGFIFLLAVSLLVLPTWFMDWASVLFNTLQGWEWVNTPLMNLAELLPGVAQFLSIFLHLVMAIYALYLMITIYGRTGRAFAYKISAVFIVAYLLHVGGSMIYLLFLIPALLLVFRFWTERWAWGHLFAWGLIILVVGGSWFLMNFNLDFSLPVEIPLLTIGLPLLVLLGMIWIRWWALNVPQLTYETR
jgi:hypothetical protein